MYVCLSLSRCILVALMEGCQFALISLRPMRKKTMFKIRMITTYLSTLISLIVEEVGINVEDGIFWKEKTST